MLVAKKEDWIDEYKFNSAITKVVWKKRFDDYGWIAVSKLTNNFTKFIKELRKQSFINNALFYKNIVTDQIVQYAHQNPVYKVVKICNEVPEFWVFEGESFHLHLYPYDDGVMIYTINVNEDKRGNGIGTDIINKLYDLSEDLLVPLYLIPYPDYEFLDKKDKEKELVLKLQNYYKRLDFGQISEKSLIYSNFE